MSFLPFYSTVYENEVEIQNSPFYFEQTVIGFELQKENDITLLNVETQNDQTSIVFKFRICKLGQTSLKITSTNRSCITFRGIIKETDEIQAVK